MTSQPVPAQTLNESLPAPLSELKNRDVVVVGLQPWYYEIGSNCKNMALEFARHNRVLYVNLPINRKTFYSKEKNPGISKHCDVVRGKGEKIRRLEENMWEFYPPTLVESINWLPSNKAFRVINYFNNKRFARDISKAIHELGFKDVILFNDNDIYNGFNLKKLLKPSIYIYYCRDFLQGYDYWKKHTSILEPKLIAKADLAVTNSMYYAEYCAKYNPNSWYIGQGCNLQLFSRTHQHNIPTELEHIPRPIIGYVGAIDSARLDEQIIRMIAETHPEWSVVLVGPEDEAFRTSDLHSLPNVHFTGRKPMERLPEYIAAFDICINPQLNNNITIGNYPLKIDEYLAMGKPVVATRTKTMELFRDYTYQAEKPEEYPVLIEQALRERSEAESSRCAEFAESHTWDNCMKALYIQINKFLQKK